jgi:predicted phosphoribosyltransferase
MFFADRFEAGRLLAAQLGEYAGDSEAIVLALPRGGVPVGFEIAKALRLPLDILVVRKLGAPGQSELALGAIASGGLRVLNQDVVQAFAISPSAVEEIAAREEAEIVRREHEYRGDRPPLDLEGRIILLADDGLATGSSMRAAVQTLRLGRPAMIVAALPVGSPETCASLAPEVDRLVCLNQPERFQAVGQWYERFDQVSDREVQDLLRRSSAPQPAQNAAPHFAR